VPLFAAGNFFKTFEMTHTVIFRGLREDDSFKKSEAKDLVTWFL
jgi:hypothetical protein